MSKCDLKLMKATPSTKIVYFSKIVRPLATPNKLNEVNFFITSFKNLKISTSIIAKFHSLQTSYKM